MVDIASPPQMPFDFDRVTYLPGQISEVIMGELDYLPAFGIGSVARQR